MNVGWFLRTPESTGEDDIYDCPTSAEYWYTIFWKVSLGILLSISVLQSQMVDNHDYSTLTLSLLSHIHSVWTRLKA